MTPEDRSYFLFRAAQEDEAARLATCDQARDRHLELASAYRLRCLLGAEVLNMPAENAAIGLRPGLLVELE